MTGSEVEVICESRQGSERSPFAVSSEEAMREVAEFHGNRLFK